MEPHVGRKYGHQRKGDRNRDINHWQHLQIGSAAVRRHVSASAPNLTRLNVSLVICCQNFDRLFRSVIAVPKAAIEKSEAKWKRKQDKKRAKKLD